jgi:predicted enzyme related to lactoylglutathione lyase
MAGEVSFIEFGVTDAAKARRFYADVFGWSFQPGPGGDGSLIEGIGVPAGIHSGDEGAAPYIFFRVDDLDAAIAAVERLGGTVEPVEEAEDAASAGEFGRFRLCRDDQGSPFGLHRPPKG